MMSVYQTHTQRITAHAEGHDAASEPPDVLNSPSFSELVCVYMVCVYVSVSSSVICLIFCSSSEKHGRP